MSTDTQTKFLNGNGINLLIKIKCFRFIFITKLKQNLNDSFRNLTIQAHMIYRKCSATPSKPVLLKIALDLVKT